MHLIELLINRWFILKPRIINNIHKISSHSMLFEEDFSNKCLKRSQCKHNSTSHLISISYKFQLHCNFQVCIAHYPFPPIWSHQFLRLSRFPRDGSGADQNHFLMFPPVRRLRSVHCTAQFVGGTFQTASRRQNWGKRIHWLGQIRRKCFLIIERLREIMPDIDAWWKWGVGILMKVKVWTHNRSFWLNRLWNI